MPAALKRQSPLRLEAPDTTWQDRATCHGEDPDLFFPVNTDSPAGAAQAADAKAVCNRCPVRAACLDWALTTGQAYGVWGGLTVDERRTLRRRGRRPQAPSSQAAARPQLVRALDEGPLILAMLADGATYDRISEAIGVGRENIAEAIRILRQSEVEAAA